MCRTFYSDSKINILSVELYYVYHLVIRSKFTGGLIGYDFTHCLQVHRLCFMCVSVYVCFMGESGCHTSYVTSRRAQLKYQPN